MSDLAYRLRFACSEVRRKSYPLSDLIPLLCQAADMLDTHVYKKEQSGFFDVPLVVSCSDPAHNAPSMMHIPMGKGYRHVCPTCGKVQVLIGKEVTL